jgi:hypothetical protein
MDKIAIADQLILNSINDTLADKVPMSATGEARHTLTGPDKQTSEIPFAVTQDASGKDVFIEAPLHRSGFKRVFDGERWVYEAVRGVLDAIVAQPPVLRERLYAAEVTFSKAGDYGRQPHIGVVMRLDPDEKKVEGVTERGSNFCGIQIHLPPEYAGQFHAGQKFWLTIAPAVEGD